MVQVHVFSSILDIAFGSKLDLHTFSSRGRNTIFNDALSPIIWAFIHHIGYVSFSGKYWIQNIRESVRENPPGEINELRFYS